MRYPKLTSILALAASVLMATGCATQPAHARTTVLLFHGGGFVSGEVRIPDARAEAVADGMRPVDVAYTLGDLSAAWHDARQAALAESGRVVAYGESAGASLAARLAQAGLVERASAWMPVTDLAHVGPALTQMFTALDPSEFALVSPALHTTANPILAQIADQDQLIDPAQTFAWAKADPKVVAQFQHGNHIWPSSPADRAVQLDAAMDYIDG